jgi:hypothetical protein
MGLLSNFDQLTCAFVVIIGAPDLSSGRFS